MKVETLACNNCGAPLSVPTTTNFATCAHCGSSLAIHRTESAHYTEVVGRLEEQTARIDQELRDLRLQHGLIKLDQQWEEERTEYKSLLKVSNDDFQEPSILRAVAIVLVAMAFPIVFCPTMPRLEGSALGGSDLVFYILLLAVPIVGLVLAANEYGKYRQYEDAVKRYYTRRDALLNSRNQHHDLT